jgi:hypothetical protein
VAEIRDMRISGLRNVAEIRYMRISELMNVAEIRDMRISGLRKVAVTRLRIFILRKDGSIRRTENICA